MAFGLKQVFGDSAHCFFAEPTKAPCMILGMSTGLHNEISIRDIGLDGVTAADGPVVVQKHEVFAAYTGNATHLVWATGGSMVPPPEMNAYCQTGKQQL